jgi:hypothetical protein
VQFPRCCHAYAAHCGKHPVETRVGMMTAAGQWAAESAEEAFAAAVAPMEALLSAAGSMLRCKQKDTERLFVLLDLACHLSWALPRLMPLLQPVRAWGGGAVGFVQCWWVCARSPSDGNERSHQRSLRFGEV